VRQSWKDSSESENIHGVPRYSDVGLQHAIRTAEKIGSRSKAHRNRLIDVLDKYVQKWGDTPLRKWGAPLVSVHMGSKDRIINAVGGSRERRHKALVGMADPIMNALRGSRERKRKTLARTPHPTWTIEKKKDAIYTLMLVCTHLSQKTKKRIFYPAYPYLVAYISSFIGMRPPVQYTRKEFIEINGARVRIKSPGTVIVEYLDFTFSAAVEQMILSFDIWGGTEIEGGPLTLLWHGAGRRIENSATVSPKYRVGPFVQQYVSKRTDPSDAFASYVIAIASSSPVGAFNVYTSVSFSGWYIRYS